MNIIRKLLAQSKVKSFILLSIAIAFAISLMSYSPSDPSFNLATQNEPSNLLKYFGSYLADMLYQLLGLVAFILPSCLLSWSYILYKEEKLKWVSLRLIAMTIAVISGSIALSKVEFYTLPAMAGGALGISLWHYVSEFKIATITAAATAIIFFALALGIKFATYTKIISLLFGFFTKTISKAAILDRVKNKLNSVDTGNAYYSEAEFSNINTYTNSKQLYKEEPRILFTKKQQPKERTQPITAKRESFDHNVIPSIDLLDENDNQKIKPLSQIELKEQSNALLSVLSDFGIKGKMTDIKQGPVVTMYEFEPSAGTKSSRVIGLADDIARSLSAVSTRIAIIPGRNALGIELPNKQRMFFRLKELIETKEFQDQDIVLPLILGKDLTGMPLIVDLAKMPHLLVAGTTGSGKSVAINAMIMSLLYRYTPDECRMVMIDPKMLELSAYDNIPHLMTPVVTEPAKAIVALKWAVKEMENRYRIMSNLGVRNIAGYNAKILETKKEGKILERKIQIGFDPETGQPIFETVPMEMHKLPFIVVIVDEMADLMLVAGKDIETSIQRLAQMARAAGIHIIMATQRPSVDVITGVIKANFPSRLSFKVTSKIDSRTILGDQGAEQLLGMGDMLYMGNSSKILRVHGPFVDDQEVERVTNFLRSTASPEYISAVTETLDDESDLGEFSAGNSEDENIYKQAVNIVRLERKSSISYIQRSLRIGYNRAANIVEEMEKNGILSVPNSAGKREILLPKD